MSNTSSTLPPGSYSARLEHILTVLVILALLAAAAATWLAVMKTTVQQNSQQQMHDVQAASFAAVAAQNKKNSPEMVTQAFMPATVPLGDAVQSVYLYRSPTTSRYLEEAGGKDEALLTPWRTFFKQSKRAHIETSDLNSVPRSRTTVLILPSSIALNAAERSDLASLQQQGVNILATWSLGTHQENGEWIGHTLYQQLFGVTVAGEVSPDSDERFLNLFGDLPLTAGYPAGQRIWLENTLEKAFRLSGGNSAALYMNWIRSAGSEADRAAIVYGEHDDRKSHARWAVFGFPETSWGSQADKLAGLLNNTLHWLARGTAIAKASWPLPYRAAYIIEMDTEEGYGNAHYFAQMMDAIGAQASFYSLTSEALRYPHLVRDLAKRHEIAFHGDVHDGFKEQPEDVQSRRLDQMLADMRSITGDTHNMVGFRAPREEYDHVTERLLHAKGFRHHTADPNRTDARLPFFSPAGSSDPAKALVVLPRTQNDDISLKAGERSSGAEQRLLRALLSDFNHAMLMGGMGLLSIHSQYFGKDSPLHAVMPAFLAKLSEHRSQVWLAAADTIANWWRERERLHYRVDGNSDSFTLDVTIKGTKSLDKGGLIVMNRMRDSSVHVHPAQGNPPLPGIQRLDAFRTALVFDGLAPGRYSFIVKSGVPAPIKNEANVGENSTTDHASVLLALNDWADAWSAKNIDAYLAYYSKDFLPPNGMSREQWAQTRKERILPKQFIKVTVSSPKIEVSGDTATVRFRQTYLSDKWKEQDHKIIVLQREDGNWRIRQEAAEGKTG